MPKEGIEEGEGGGWQGCGEKGVVTSCQWLFRRWQGSREGELASLRRFLAFNKSSEREGVVMGDDLQVWEESGPRLAAGSQEWQKNVEFRIVRLENGRDIEI